MTGGSVSDRTGGSAGSERTSRRLALWGVGLAAVVAVLIVFSAVIFAVAYARGGSDAISDNWVGFLGAVAILGGLPTSLTAFALAIAARVRHQQWAWLWLPLSVFPALFAFVVLGEVFWWE